jgi:hypothetical protein
MKIAFLTEMNFEGKIPKNHPNMRTEFAWMFALDANHHWIKNWKVISGYDVVFIIFPKGGVFLNSEGKTLTNDKNAYSDIFSSTIVDDLKNNNKQVCAVQEGPTWFVNDFTLEDQFNFWNQLYSCDAIFAHNEHDTKWYQGMYPNKKVGVMQTLMIDELIRDIIPTKELKVIIGGNFSRWYGGFQSYMVAGEIPLPVYVQTSHSSRLGEEQIPSLTVLPRMYWNEWMSVLSTFKYAIHMMPTIAAGTFSLNCAYFGIPCIGNNKVDTQLKCFPSLSIDPEDVKSARELSKRLWEDDDFYKQVSEESKETSRQFCNPKSFVEKVQKVLS